jgi:radical SAM enzyme (TIGR01210 family)
MLLQPSVYPDSNNDRDNWILQKRQPRSVLNPALPYAFSMDEECAANGEVVSVATVFLTNKECPWRCLMCDLWQNTLKEKVPVGAIPAQIDYALSRLRAARQIKLYNSGSFFDLQAIPLEDYPAIAARCNAFERVIVESHPTLVGSRCLQFRNHLTGKLEVAMGLETVHPEILPKLNKRMTLDQFSRAADWLRENKIDLRVFILVKPPFMQEEEAGYWAEQSIDFAFDCGASVAVLIPTRAGNGAMDELAANGEFSPPKMGTLEAAVRYGLSNKRGRVFADLWDLEKISRCTLCYSARFQRLNAMNLLQTASPEIHCTVCGGQ